MEEEIGGSQVGLREGGEGEDGDWSRIQGRTPYLLGWKKRKKGFDVGNGWVGNHGVKVCHL